jgi:hypothetical protein
MMIAIRISETVRTGPVAGVPLDLGDGIDAARLDLAERIDRRRTVRTDGQGF